jgi:hypothetical protein
MDARFQWSPWLQFWLQFSLTLHLAGPRQAGHWRANRTLARHKPDAASLVGRPGSVGVRGSSPLSSTRVTRDYD